MSAAGAEPWLNIVGCLPGGRLAPTAPDGVLDAPAVFGAARMLEAAGVQDAHRKPWPSPLSAGIDAIVDRRGEPTTVLASGDPLYHGVATTLLRALPAREVAVFPAPSALSLAAAALRWPLEKVRCISLHTAPEASIVGHAAPGRRLLALTRNGESPAKIASALSECGYGDSAITVLERLGGPDEARRDATAATLSGNFHALNTVAVECVRQGPVSEAALDHDGCVTRDEVRLLTIAALGGGTGHLWDVGAGSGAVAIDHIRAGGRATLFERMPARVAAIRRNLADAADDAAPVFEGDAKAWLSAAETPDAVFMGGAVGDGQLFDALWARLPAGGILVSNAVTVEGEAATLARFAEFGGSLTRIALSFSGPVGGLNALRPAMPVLQWRVVKA